MSKSRNAASGPIGLTGKAAPAFALAASGGGKVRLSAFKGQKVVVLFFYSRDMTPG